jgi:hypothetical protein
MLGGAVSDQQPPQGAQDPIDPASGQPGVPPPVPPSQPVPPLPPAPQPGSTGQPYGAPINQPPPSQFPPTPGYGAAVPAAVPQTNTNAIVAFVVSILSWLFCPIIAAIVALVFASKAKKEIEQSGGWQTGSGFVTAAKVIAWINIAAMVLVFGTFAVVAIISVGAGVNNSDAVSTILPTLF